MSADVHAGIVGDTHRTALDRLAVLIWLLPLAAFVLLAASLVKSCNQAPPLPRRQVVRIDVLPDMPPPPPPVVQRVEPPKAAEPTRKPIEVESAPPPPPLVPPAPAQAPALRMEGAATDAASPFAAGAVTHDYVGQAIGDGPANGGAGRMQWSLYATHLQRQLQDRLGREAELRGSTYRCTLRVWLAPDGSVQRCDGQPGVDAPGASPAAAPSSEACQAVTQALLKLGRVADAPPAGLPQPVVLRVANRRSAN